jgi:hypothetical protein
MQNLNDADVFSRPANRLHRETDDYFASLMEANKASVRLIGPRRTGKTDMVTHYAEMSDAPLLTITLKPILASVKEPEATVARGLVDATKRLLHTHPKLYNKFRSVVEKEYPPRSKQKSQVDAGVDLFGVKLKGTLSNETSPGHEPSGPDMDPDQLIVFGLSRLEMAAKELKLRPIIFFDEIQELAVRTLPQLPTVWAIRNEAQHHQALRYVFAGSNQRLFAELHARKNSPLLNFGRELAIPPLSLPELDAWALPILHRGKRRVSTLEPIHRLLSGKIGEIVEVLDHLWVMTRPSEIIYEQTLLRAVERASLQKEAIGEILHDLSEQQAHLLETMLYNPGLSPYGVAMSSKHGLSKGAIQNGLKELVRLGLVEDFGEQRLYLSTPLRILATFNPADLPTELRAKSLRSGPNKTIL